MCSNGIANAWAGGITKVFAETPPENLKTKPKRCVALSCRPFLIMSCAAAAITNFSFLKEQFNQEVFLQERASK